jgi:two-component system phosphate regulon sensor histidine kinase PhoR
MLAAGAGAGLTLGVVVLWCGSLWLTRPDPMERHAYADLRGEADDQANLVIERLGTPLVIMSDNRVIAANAAARAALGQHIVDQDARVALRHPQAIALLDLEDGASVVVPGVSGARTVWQLTRRRIDARRWLIELADRTSEADVARAHTDFVANASHELRTPLASIIGYVETLAEQPEQADPEIARKFLQTVLREARRIQSLVSDLMSLSQLEAEKHDAPDEAIDLGQLTELVIGEFKSGSRGARLELGKVDEGLLVQGDRAQLEQLLRNLIDNALKYGDESLPIVVEARAIGGHANLNVTDRGAGIEPEHLPHLTRRFYRTDPGRSRAAGGTGLGLAIVKHIVERHRGKLNIASTPGIGTTVSVDLPRVPATAEALS